VLQLLTKPHHYVIRYITVIFLLLLRLCLRAQDIQSVLGPLPLSDRLLLQSEVQQKMDSICSLPNHYIDKIDSLLQSKAQLLQTKTSALHTKATGNLQDPDSLSTTRVGELVNDNLDKLTPEQYTAKLNNINESLQTYQSQITDSEELKWVEHYSGQLDQLEGVVGQYQNKLLNLEDLQALKGYGQQLKQLSQESSGYFKEDKINPSKRLIAIKFGLL